jgi:XRE family aerobic/anaerobic benzoate catabolism transcriptional regulator
MHYIAAVNERELNGLLERIGARVRQARTERRLTLRELSGTSGVSQRFLSQLEAGEANIAIGRLAAVAHALDVPLADLVKEADENRPLAIALLGLRGAGKSTIGPRLARALKVPFIELDEKIEEAAGLGLAEIFALHGEAYYRRLEEQCLAALLANGGGSVIALPGGIVSSEGAFELARRHCTTVWLKARPEDHMRRVLAQGDRRPMADRPNAMAELKAILAARGPSYAQADITIDTSRHDRAGAVRSLLTELERL